MCAIRSIINGREIHLSDHRIEILRTYKMFHKCVDAFMCKAPKIHFSEIPFSNALQNQWMMTTMAIDWQKEEQEEKENNVQKRFSPSISFSCSLYRCFFTKKKKKKADKAPYLFWQSFVSLRIMHRSGICCC